MTNLTPRPKATGQGVSEDLGRGRGKVRPLLLPGPRLRVEKTRGTTTPSPAGPRPLGHPPRRDLSVPDSGPGARQQQPGEEVWRGGCSPPSWAPPRRRPAGTEPELSGTPPAARMPRAVVAVGRRGLPVARNPTKSTSPWRSAYRASRRGPGARWGPWELRPPAEPLRVRELSLRTAPRASVSPGGLASPRRGAPLARAARPRPQTAPRPDGPAPVAPAAPSRLCAPLRSLQGKLLLDSTLTRFRQLSEEIVLDPKSVSSPHGECEE